MKYEITIDERTWNVDIEHAPDGAYSIQLDDGETQLVQASHLDDDIISILLNGKSLDVGHLRNDDGFEIVVRGERYLTQVIDPRKKALRLGEGAGGDKVVTRMPGRVMNILVSEGETVTKGQTVLILEAMKMENPFKAPRDGVVSSINVQTGDVVDAKQVLLTLA